MATGLAVPVGVDSGGGARLESGSDNSDKIVKLGLGSDENENAFQQDIGVGIGMIFDVNDPTLRARIMGRIFDVFRRFEAQNRFRLRQNTIRWEENPTEGELILIFLYVDLESDDERLFRQNFRGTEAGGRS